MAFCTSCGNPLSDQASFCVQCGGEVSDPPAPPAAEPTASPAPPPAPPAAEPISSPVSPPAPPVHEPVDRPAVAAPPLEAPGPTPAASAPIPAPQVEAAGLASPPGLPSWLPAAWLPAGRIGLTALAIGLAAQYALGAVMVLIQMLSGIGVDWGASLRAPLTVFLSLHGPVDGLGLWATGTGWILLAFWLAGRHLRAGSGRPASLQPALVLAARSAFVYMVPVLVLALLFNPEQLPIDTEDGARGWWRPSVCWPPCSAPSFPSPVPGRSRSSPDGCPRRSPPGWSGRGHCSRPPSPECSASL